MTQTHHSGTAGKDQQLWELAQKRVSFKHHLATYIIMSVFFWVMWAINDGISLHNGIPWPVFPMLGWGVGVAIHFVQVYIAPKNDAVQKEYDRLVQEQSLQNQ